MYTELGKNKIVASKDVVAIFDLDITSQSHLTRKFLSGAEKAGELENAADDIPKSFVLCFDNKNKKKMTYLSQMAPATLVKKV